MIQEHGLTNINLYFYNCLVVPPTDLIKYNNPNNCILLTNIFMLWIFSHKLKVNDIKYARIYELKEVAENVLLFFYFLVS
jgi:hypothetical protein